MLSESPSQLRVTPHLSAPARDSHLGLALAAAHLGPAPLRTGGRLRRWTWAAAAHQPRQARLRPARLLGDDAHPVIRFKGRGTNQALLDGLMLSEDLHNYLSIDRSSWIQTRKS